MAVTLPLGTRMPMARGYRRIRAQAVMRLGVRRPVDTMARSGNEVYTHSTPRTEGPAINIRFETTVRVTREPQLTPVPVGTPLEEACSGTSVALLTSFPVCIVPFCSLGCRPQFRSLGNGGDGGDASSGSAYAHGSSAKAFSGPGGDASRGSINDAQVW